MLLQQPARQMGLTGLCVGQLLVLYSRASGGATQTEAFHLCQGTVSL